MGGPPASQAVISPEMRAQQRQAESDKISAIQDRTSDATRDVLVRFGRRKAFAGTDLGGGLSGLSSLFEARNLDLRDGL